MKIIGIEDIGLYVKSVENYGNLADKREEILDYLKKYKTRLKKLKSNFIPGSL